MCTIFSYSTCYHDACGSLRPSILTTLKQWKWRPTSHPSGPRKWFRAPSKYDRITSSWINVVRTGTHIKDRVGSIGISWTEMGRNEAQTKSGGCYQSRVNPCTIGKNNKGPLYLVHLQFWKPKVELKRMIQQEHRYRRESKYEDSPYNEQQRMDDSQSL